MFRIWSDVGLESMSNPGATIQLSDVNNKVLIQIPDQTSKLTRIRFAKGNLLFDDQESVLGINGDKIEAYQKRDGTHHGPGHRWSLPRRVHRTEALRSLRGTSS